MSFLVIVIFFEVLTAIIGTIYFNKKKYRVNKLTRYFIWVLWLTVFVEIIFGLAPKFLKGVESLVLLREFLLKYSYLVYNIYVVITFLFYVFYFKYNIYSKKINNVLNVVVLICFVLVVTILFFTGVDFESNWPIVDIVGSILIFVSVMLYFLEIFNSDKILSIHKEISFYIAVGAI